MKLTCRHGHVLKRLYKYEKGVKQTGDTGLFICKKCTSVHTVEVVVTVLKTGYEWKKKGKAKADKKDKEE